MQIIPNTVLEKIVTYPALVDQLKAGLVKEVTVPARSHYELSIPGQSEKNTVLIMPAWNNDLYFGIKTVMVAPHNPEKGLATIQGTYLLHTAKTGECLAFFDAKTLTNLRTAAASALAAQFLSKPESHCLFVIGTGALVPYLIRAHCSVRPIQEILIWGRNKVKAQEIMENPSLKPYKIRLVHSIREGIQQADIITSATSAKKPIIFGEFLQPGQHLDLVGSFKPHMREADDLAIKKSQVFVDIRSTAPKESGDLAIPIRTGVLKPSDIKGDLLELCQKKRSVNRKPEDITLFKSVGHAAEDLITAQFAFESFSKTQSSEEF